ncbi:class I SAM-dependent methyltransferase [Stackebrandtia nassauensis]|uniref:Methyltransferase type 11 n=1 Tax=Stackebrandtia nassauensis (strain DSM 44728 / CIP 108903 / NRRL B-16338 / NBRC 102104 / LLR-40K-21) TaxID=446470 RepID=D3PZP8_STANL|nr:class I SAM-dependent methyltransferase [Stackebrandtia nassauensis]ADD43585.1 Methyltransferase type 11 [Stackebrandtia nassauensis DSM 44728]
MTDPQFLARSYEAYAEVEAEFNDALDVSLDPCGPGMLFDLVAEIGLPAGARALDVGCGEGGHAFELADRFGLRVHGVDPVPRHIDIAKSQARPESTAAVTFEAGTAQALPVADASVDLVWCRDTLCHVEDLDAAYAEFRRVLKPDGTALVYQMFATDTLEPNEAAWLFSTMGCIPSSMDPTRSEAAMMASGLSIERRLVLGTQWGERGQETTGKGGRKLLHAARLLREPERYVSRYGRSNYDIALGDCLWHVYRLIGKLSDRVYRLRRPSG